MAETYETDVKGLIVVRGAPSITKERAIGTTGIKPGMLVEYKDNDFTVKAATAEPCGWVGFEHTDLNVRPETSDTAYNQGDVVTILSGGGFELITWLTGEGSTGSDVTVHDGTPLTLNGDGTLKKAADGEWVVAIAKETVTVTKGTSTAGTVVRVKAQALI